MLKHVHISPLRNRSADSISLKSSSSSLCGSPEPPSDSHQMTPSRSSSYSSLNESIPQVNREIFNFTMSEFRGCPRVFGNKEILIKEKII